jgi:hypothetical protein
VSWLWFLGFHKGKRIDVSRLPKPMAHYEETMVTLARSSLAWGPVCRGRGAIPCRFRDGLFAPCFL